MLCRTALVLALATGAGASAEECVQIVSTNDVHGHLVSPARSSTPSDRGAGLASFGGYVSILRHRFPGQVLLLDAGDLFQGTLASNQSKGAAVIAAYNTLGYQAAAVGNHEFDFGAEKDAKDPRGALKARIREAHFPFLASNLFEKGTGKRPGWVKPSLLLRVGDIPVGIVGAITRDTAAVTMLTNVADLDFRPGATEVAHEAAALRRQGAKLVILLAHIGGACARFDDPRDLSSCEQHSEIFDLIEALPPGAVDVAISGHTHQFIDHEFRGVAVSESGALGQAFGWTQSCLKPDGGVSTTLHPPILMREVHSARGGLDAGSPASEPPRFLDEPVVPSAEVEAAIQPFMASVQKEGSAPLGATMAVGLARNHDAPSALGELVAEAVRRAAPGASLGLMNGGGIRADLPAGPLKFNDAFEVMPFDDQIVSLTLTGAQLKALLFAPIKTGHGFPQLSGAHLSVVGGEPSLTLADGSPIDDQRDYVVATNDFIANGGDGTEPVVRAIEPRRRKAMGTLVRDALIAYLVSLPQPIRVP